MVSAIPSVVSNVTYSADQNVVRYQLANGVVVEQPRSAPSLRLERITARHGTTVLRELGYTHDAIGNIQMILDEMPGDVEHHALRSVSGKQVPEPGRSRSQLPLPGSLAEP